MNNPPPIEDLVKAAERGNSAAQYNLGVCYLRGDGVERDIGLARHWIEQAVESGLAPAQSALGYMYLRAQGVTYDPVKAVALFQRAAAQGFAEAIYRYGEAQATGLGCRQDSAAARTEFVRAAEAGHPQAQCQLAYCLDEGIGGPAEPATATAWFFRAACRGDARASAAIAVRYLSGHTLEADATSAFTWLLRAQAAGYAEVAADIGVLREQIDPEEVAIAQAKAQQPANADTADPGLVVKRAPVLTGLICESPRICRLENLLSVTECWHLMHIALPFLRRSQVLSSESGEVVRTGGRSSGGMSIIEPMRDVVVCNIEQRLANIAGIPAENGEPLALLRYERGDEYRPHFDFFDPIIPGQATGLEDGGQRLVSILMYLCDVAAGGETLFPNAGVSVSPQRGAGVLFHNCTPDGAIDRSSRHAGAPIRRGQKWLATKWLREREFIVPSLQVASHVAPDDT